MKYINHFLKHLRNLSYSKNTITEYTYILQRFKKYLDENEIYDEKNVSETNFINYISKYKNKDLHSAYYKSFVSIKKYFKYLEENNHIFISPIKKIRNPKQVTKHHPILQKNEIEKYINLFTDENPSDIRTRAILELIYSSALRPGECINLNIQEIDFSTRMILIKKTKTKRDRIVPVTKKAIYWLNEYITKTRKKYIKKKDPGKIFISFKTGKIITVKGINNTLRDTFKRKKIKPFSLYSIRATSATHLFENGMSISYLKLLLGHTDLRATVIYVRVSFLILKEILKKSHPRLKLEDKNKEDKEDDISKAV